MIGIHFICPKCGSERLMRVESALHRYGNLSIEPDSNGSLCVTQQDLCDDLSGDLLGYRCMDCRYPDSMSNNGPDVFQWKTLEDVKSFDALWGPEIESMIEHKCMICYPDGTMISLVVKTSLPGALSPEQRKLVLNQENVQGAILLCQEDRGIRSFATANWKKVKRVYPHPSIEKNKSNP